MTARRLAALLVMAAAAALSPRAGRAEPAREESEESEHADGGDTAVSEEGRRFRVRFDPASRVWLGVASALHRGAGGAIEIEPEIDAGLSYRARSVTGSGPGRVVWQADHRVLAGRVSPAGQALDGVPALDAALYGASFLRHDESPRVVLPMSPPIAVPFPFDIGAEAEVGRVSIPSIPRRQGDGSPAPLIRLGVARATAILDPWRTGEAGRSFEIGLGVRYDIDAYAESPSPRAAPARRTLGEPRVVHRIAPMTAGSLRLRLQSGDGLTVFDGRGDVVPHWTSEERWRVLVRSAAHVERILAAIDDQPIAAVIEGEYRLLPPALDVQAVHDLRVSLGLAFTLALR
ncbi:hypothetical protein WME95_11840 [Sorangium sp. So ce327]|uniref:hypothetical protein n=1 Tax=Sorangium sp. So ce327 TaxID=3133301 RepID=UPI003F5FF374